MSTLLNIEVSPRAERSISRALANRFVEHWQHNNPGGKLIQRDLDKERIPYMDNDWIAGVYAPPEVPRTPQMQQALDLSAELITELQAADDILISTPMYNFSIPAVLKSWIDYVVRPGFTFQLAPGWPGMLENKRARLIVVSRDVYGDNDVADQVSPVLRKALGFIGIKDVEVLHVGGSLAVNLGKLPLGEHVDTFDSAILGLASR